MMTWIDEEVRRDLCAGCDCGTNKSDPCATCPRGRWPKHGDCNAAELPGDALAEQIEARVLSPIEQAIPAAAPIVAAVRKCGGCTQARHAIGSRQEHPEAGAPVV